jgi:hypothetical protein
VVAQKWHDTLTPNVPLQYGYNTADGYDGGVLPLLRWVRLSTLVVPQPRADGVLLSRLEQLPSDRVLDLLGVRYLIANASVAERPGLPVAVDFGDLRIFARPDPVPRDLIVFSATSATSDDAALARMRDPSFDPNREVVLGDGQGLRPSTAAPIAVTPDKVSAGRWQARVRLTQDGYLLQREAWYPGWRARVDGIDVPVLRADVLLRAVALTAGEHDVEIYFESATFQRGLLISLVALAMVALLFALPIIRTRVRR